MLPTDGGRVEDDVLAEHLRRPAVRRQQRREHAEERGLAAAVRPQETEERDP